MGWIVVYHLFQCQLRQAWFVATAAAWLETKISSGDSVKRLHLDGDSGYLSKGAFQTERLYGLRTGIKKGVDSGSLQIKKMAVVNFVWRSMFA